MSELTNAARTKRWRRQKPDCGGWWLYREFGCQPERLLISDSGREVASDEEWENEMGRPIDEVWSENYWEATSTEEMTRYGHWMFDAPKKPKG